MSLQLNDSPVGVSGTAEGARHAGRLATIISLAAFAFSGLSFYKSVLEAADLEVFVAPVLHYARDSGGDIELFAIPITITNEGARTGTVLAMELFVLNHRADADPKEKVYYSAYVGEFPREAQKPKKAFAPISIAGRATFSDTVLFYPQGNALPRLVQQSGEYRFKLRIRTAQAVAGWWDPFTGAGVRPLVFEMRLPYISDQGLNFRRDMIGMHAKDWQPTTSSGAAAK